VAGRSTRRGRGWLVHARPVTYRPLAGTTHLLDATLQLT
jgi:hypothetical protein